MTALQPDQLTKLSRGFLRPPSLNAEQGGVIVQAGFDVHRFEPALFERLGIARPDALSRAVDKRLAEFLAGRALAQVAQAALGLVPSPVPMGDDRAPRWPAGVAGSISHSRDVCVCFALPEGAGTPGIDVEDIARGEALMSIFSATMNAEEIALAVSEPDPGLIATLCFSAKEALYKALYPRLGRLVGFECAELRAPPRNGLLRLWLTQSLHPDFADGQVFDISYESGPDRVLTWMAAPEPSRAGMFGER